MGPERVVLPPDASLSVEDREAWLQLHRHLLGAALALERLLGLRSERHAARVTPAPTKPTTETNDGLTRRL